MPAGEPNLTCSFMNILRVIYSGYVPHHDRTYYRHPEGKPVFDISGGKPRESLTQPGVFADCEDIREVEAFDWPDPTYLDLTDTLHYIDNMHDKGKYIFSGAWAPFFHDLCDFFGMENYFLKMFTAPAIVEAVTERVIDFYLVSGKSSIRQDDII